MKKQIHADRFMNLMLALVVISGALIIFSQFQILSVYSSLGKAGDSGAVKTSSRLSGKSISATDISAITSTAMALATVFPELKNAKTEQEVTNAVLPSGTPEYSGVMGGISFDDPINSLNYLSRWYDIIKNDVKQNNPKVWQRYLNLAAAPRGISCEFCCGVGPQGIDENGESRCGCQHNPALQAVTLGLMKNTDYSDAEILREVMRWKTLFFPKDMVALGVQVAGQDASQLKSLPGMVGGC